MEQAEKIQILESRLDELESKFFQKKTSKNSSIPPSRDQKSKLPGGKKNGLREKSLGRKSYVRELHPDPDEIIDSNIYIFYCVVKMKTIILKLILVVLFLGLATEAFSMTGEGEKAHEEEETGRRPVRYSPQVGASAQEAFPGKPLISLPEDVLLHIVKFLNPEQLSNLACTCHSLHNLFAKHPRRVPFHFSDPRVLNEYFKKAFSQLQFPLYPTMLFVPSCLRVSEGLPHSLPAVACLLRMFAHCLTELNLQDTPIEGYPTDTTFTVIVPDIHDTFRASRNAVGPQEALVLGTILRASIASKRVDAGDNAMGAITVNGRDYMVPELRRLPQALAFPHLVKVSLKNQALTARGLEGLEPLFSRACALKELDLEGNVLEAKGTAILCRFFPAMPLEVLNLENNDLGQDGATILAKNLRFLYQLKRLHLGWNYLGSNGVKGIAQALAQANPQLPLKELSVQYNHMRNLDDVEDFSRCLLAIHALQVLDLRGNYIPLTVTSDLVARVTQRPFLEIHRDSIDSIDSSDDGGDGDD